MADCECLDGCLFFHDKMEEMPGISHIYKNRYCRGSNRDCARHIVFSKLGREAVPVDLFPNEVDRALAVIGEVAKLTG